MTLPACNSAELNCFGRRNDESLFPTGAWNTGSNERQRQILAGATCNDISKEVIAQVTVQVRSSAYNMCKYSIRCRCMTQLLGYHATHGHKRTSSAAKHQKHSLSRSVITDTQIWGRAAETPHPGSDWTGQIGEPSVRPRCLKSSWTPEITDSHVTVFWAWSPPKKQKKKQH